MPTPIGDRRTRRAIIRNAVRWANNIIVEVVHNHGRALNDEEHEVIKRITAAISDFQRLGEEGDFS